MAKLVLAMFISLDGYIEGPQGEFVGPAWSGQIATEWAHGNLRPARHLLYGRTSFVFNRDFWSAAETDPSSPAAGVDHAPIMNQLPKTVLSRTLLGDPGWNATIVSSDVGPAIKGLKKSVAGGDIYAFGGAGLANTLVALDLVDEYRIMVTPSLLGDGKRLFESGVPRLALRLIDARPLDTGAVILHYARQP